MVPYPWQNRYRVQGIDIFGRHSDFGAWSDPAKVSAVPPPPPSGVRAKWLDVADPQLTDAERNWIATDGRSALLLRWEWTSPLDRQAPYLDGFNVLFQRGWLNVLQAEARTAPVAVNGGDPVFSVGVAFDRAIGVNTLAGTTMSREGVPYHIRTNTAAVGPESGARFSARCPIPGYLHGAKVPRSRCPSRR